MGGRVWVDGGCCGGRSGLEEAVVEEMGSRVIYGSWRGSGGVAIAWELGVLALEKC